MGRSRDPTIHSPKMVSWLEDRLGSDLPAQAVAGSPVRQGESHDTHAAPPMGSRSAPHRRGHDNRRVCRGHPRPHDGTLLRRRRQSKAGWRRSADVHIAADQWRGFPAQETTVVAVPHVLPSLAGEEDSFRPRHTWPGRQGLVTARTSAAQRDGRRPDSTGPCVGRPTIAASLCRASTRATPPNQAVQPAHHPQPSKDALRVAGAGEEPQGDRPELIRS